MYNIALIGPDYLTDFQSKEIYKAVSDEMIPMFDVFITKALKNENLIKKYSDINIVFEPVLGFNTIIMAWLYENTKNKLKYSIIISVKYKEKDNIELDLTNNNDLEILKTTLKEEYNYTKEKIDLFEKIILEDFKKNKVKVICIYNNKSKIDILEKSLNKKNEEINLYLLAYKEASDYVNKLFKKLEKEKKALYDLNIGKMLK